MLLNQKLTNVATFQAERMQGAVTIDAEEVKRSIHECVDTAVLKVLLSGRRATSWKIEASPAS
jgi:hypothetical protein